MVASARPRRSFLPLKKRHQIRFRAPLNTAGSYCRSYAQAIEAVHRFGQILVARTFMAEYGDPFY